MTFLICYAIGALGMFALCTIVRMQDKGGEGAVAVLADVSFAVVWPLIVVVIVTLAIVGAVQGARLPR